jgi:hypothetical protein
MTLFALIAVIFAVWQEHVERQEKMTPGSPSVTILRHPPERTLSVAGGTHSDVSYEFYMLSCHGVIQKFTMIRQKYATEDWPPHCYIRYLRAMPIGSPSYRAEILPQYDVIFL